MALLIFALLVVVIVVAIISIRRRRRARLRHNAPLPPLIFEVHDDVTPFDLRPASIRPSEITPPGVRASAASGRSSETSSSTRTPASFAGASAAVPNGATVQVPRNADVHPPFLPGRLEIQAGPSRGESIRFRRTSGDEADITLGRGEGPPETHVQVHAETVSRLHARLRFDHGRWKISNLSRTNPLIVNGQPLNAGAAALWLSDGDRIEMGEMTFAFHDI